MENTTVETMNTQEEINTYMIFLGQQLLLA